MNAPLTARPLMPTLVERTDFQRSRALITRAHELIPGGNHTYAKGDDQFPERSPGFIVRGKGCHVWDMDGNEYIEYGMGLRAVTLGHAYAPVVEAAYRQMLSGNNFSRPSPVELECAEMLQSLVPSSEMIKFAKDGSAVNTAALKLARAYTGRKKVAICADSPFFSYNDWFIGMTAIIGGIPDENTANTLTFRYNDLGSLQALFDRHPGEIAMVLLEPARQDEPADNFLIRVAELCRRQGAVFMLDETITGFRWNRGGAQATYGVRPDLSCFGKAMSNGFALSALTGRREIMELGGIRHAGERVFLLSTTHGAETPALGAATETMRIYRDEPVVEHLYRIGERLRVGFETVVADAGVQDHLKLTGRPCSLVFTTTDHDGQPSQAFRTLFMQELIRWGVLGPSFLVSYSHDENDIDVTVEAVRRAAQVYRQALDARTTDGLLVGQPSRTVYRRFN